MSTLEDSVTHVVGPAVIYKKRVIQRCCLCGEKLLDYKHGTTKQVEETEVIHEGFMVQLREVQGTTQFFDMGKFGTDPVPRDFCIVLVEN